MPFEQGNVGRVLWFTCCRYMRVMPSRFSSPRRVLLYHPGKATLHPHEVFVEGSNLGGSGGSGGSTHINRSEFATRVQEAMCRRRACEALLAYR